MIAKQPGTTEGLRAALYVRVSTSKQENEGTSLSSQEEHCRQYAAEKGYTVDEREIYSEVFTGLELWDRPRLSELRDSIRRDRIDVLIVYSTDRLARDPVHLAIIAEECDRHNVDLAFITEPLDTSDEGGLIRYVKGYAAKIEHEKIRERTLRGKRTLALNGRLHNTAIDLYGYRRDKEARTRSVYEPEAAVVRQLFRWYVEDRMAVRGIVRRLRDAGTPSPSVGKVTYSQHPRTARWGPTMVYRILRNTEYKGEAFAWRYRSSKTHGGIFRLHEEWIPLPNGTTPAIVPSELFDAAQDRLSERSAAASRNAKRPFLLRGLIKCRVCGCSASPEMEHGKRGIYRCSSRDTARGVCGGKRVNADDVEAWVWEQVSALLRDPALIASELNRLREKGPDITLTNDLERAQRTLSKLIQQQERLVRRLREVDDNDIWALIEREIASIQREKQQTLALVSEIEQRLAQQCANTDRLDALVAYCASIAGKLQVFGFDEKRLALEALGVGVSASGSKREPDWHITGAVPIGVGVLSQTLRHCAPLPPRFPGHV